MKAFRPAMTILLVLLVLACAAAYWTAHWLEKRPIPGAGGLWFPQRLELSVPHFLQADPRWANDNLANTTATLAAEGCAVACAAMVLASRGIDTDPARLNRFLCTLPDGFTSEGWIYWEKAAEFAPEQTSGLLPHYEDLPSFYLIDMNLLRGNPVIARLRFASGITHFVVIVGKHGFDYLIADPGPEGVRGVYPLRDFGSPVEAIRFYQPPRQWF
jgi:hypothetical protein